MEDFEEFMTEKKQSKKPYQKRIRKDGTKVVIADTSKLSPADRAEVEMLVQAGYDLKRKREDLNKSTMESYVRNNYDEKELKWWQNEVAKSDNFMRLKKEFKETYIFYPKGTKYKYSDDKKQERFENAFNSHKEDLSKKHNQEKRGNESADGAQNNNNKHGNK